jgi:serine/threonine protein kinase
VKRDTNVVGRLKSEIRLARKISHRNVVRAHDLGEFQGTYFISMEYVKGITVAELLGRRGRLSVDATLAIGLQLAEALAVAHEATIVHRDIKPANLLVDEQGVMKVMDFGIARLVERDDELTLSGFVVGTPHYMAPEQLMGGAVDSRSDLFAAGVVLYECLAGRPPFVADAPTTLLAQISSGNVTPLTELVRGMPAGLDVIVRQLLQFQPAHRIASARELANQLAQIEHTAARDSQSLLDVIDLEIVEQI